ncbi:MAG: hypothetical protein C4K60_15845 [Ideonella sp. MAG2]|nr:MAG: hypothetical protein C4K60_15845 [Ideonella sp. MAG2]
MRLPHLFLDRLCFGLSGPEELLRVLGPLASPGEDECIRRLCALDLPPVSSPRALAAMLGVSEGLVWSMLHRQHRHYRHFSIPKGRGSRDITAPRVALKVIQKWLAVRLQAKYYRPGHVFGFVPGLSHIDAARQHLGARWVCSFDIENFFPTTPEGLVAARLVDLGFPESGAGIVARLACFSGVLAQGAPTSPVLSNIALCDIDQRLSLLAERYSLRLTRYADDIVFSGLEAVPDQLAREVYELFAASSWRLSEAKTERVEIPSRLKVHGLLVHGEEVRLTKAYRNRIRAYRYLMERNGIQQADLPKVKGHLSFAESVRKAGGASFG